MTQPPGSASTKMSSMEDSPGAKSQQMAASRRNFSPGAMRGPVCRWNRRCERIPKLPRPSGLTRGDESTGYRQQGPILKTVYGTNTVKKNYRNRWTFEMRPSFFAGSLGALSATAELWRRLNRCWNDTGMGHYCARHRPGTPKIKAGWTLKPFLLTLLQAVANVNRKEIGS